MADPSKALDLSKLFERHPTLETERLLLREIRMLDKRAIFEYASDPETTEYMIFPTHTSVAEAERFIESCGSDFLNTKRVEFAIELKSTKKMIGAFGLHHFSSNHHSVEFGYILNRAHWGNGYVTEVVNRMLRFAFDEMQMHRVQAVCDLKNDASARVLERCGFTHEATFRDHEFRRGRFISLNIYGKLATDQ